MTPLDRFNSQHPARAEAQLLACCGSYTWASRLAALRPFPTLNELIEQGEAIWATLTETDWLEAFAHHPRIGEKKAPTTAFLASSITEQAAAQKSLDQVAVALTRGNRAYEEKFGFIYIVFASGRSAPELLEILNRRLARTREEELQEAARQQLQITNLRLRKWLQP
jgi:OHCU decarboxylase